MIPDAQSLVRLSQHLVRTRPTLSSPIAFPDAPRFTDLDVLAKTTPPPQSNLTEGDILALSELYADLVRVCERGEKRGVKLIIDAEYTYATALFISQYIVSNVLVSAGGIRYEFVPTSMLTFIDV